MSWMLTLLSFFFVFSLWGKCELQNPSQKIISLSGPVTVLFNELKLLNSLDGISVFHPVSRKDYKGAVYPGGIFIASKSLASLRGKVLFFDESRELNQILSGVPEAKLIEVRTRGILPHEVSERVVKEVTPYLKNCQNELMEFMQKTLTTEKAITHSLKEKPRLVFFVGDLVMANDGAVTLLKKENRIETYPSELAYVSWSAKVMSQLKGFTKIHLKDSAADLIIKSERRPDGSLEVTYPGILIPGLSQVQGFKYMFEKEGNNFVKP